MPSAMMAVIGLLVGAGVAPAAGPAASLFSAGDEPETDKCDLPRLTLTSRANDKIMSDCTTPEASIEDVSMASAVCEGTVEMYVESETSVSRKTLLWGLWEDVETHNHETFYVAYQLACEAAFSATVRGEGSVVRTVTFERGYTAESSGGPVGAIASDQGTKGGGVQVSGTVNQEDERRCSYSGLPGNEDCFFIYIAEPIDVVSEEVSGVKKTPTERKVCIDPPAMTAYNRPSYVPADVDLLNTRGSSDEGTICQDVTIFWAGGPVLVEAIGQAVQALNAGEADDDDEALLDFAEAIGLHSS